MTLEDACDTKSRHLKCHGLTVEVSWHDTCAVEARHSRRSECQAVTQRCNLQGATLQVLAVEASNAKQRHPTRRAVTLER